MECLVDHLRDQTDPLFLRGDDRERTRQWLDALSVFFRAFATTTFLLFLVVPALVYVDKKFNQYFFNDKVSLILTSTLPMAAIIDFVCDS